ncbi:MAG: hypothetical protein HQK52_19625 [Oligoflexia bacterium]|nr:hypothetical protein [Oligoflexia bacterium]
MSIKLNFVALVAAGLIPMSVFAENRDSDTDSFPDFANLSSDSLGDNTDVTGAHLLPKHDLELAKAVLAKVGVDVSKITDKELTELLNSALRSSKDGLAGDAKLEQLSRGRSIYAQPCMVHEDDGDDVPPSR